MPENEAGQENSMMSARESALSRVAPPEPVQPEEVAEEGSQPEEVAGQEAGGVAEKGTGVPDKSTPPEVSEAARTLASHRSKMRREVAQEMVEEGELEAEDVEEIIGEAEGLEGAAAEDEETRAPTPAEEAKAEAIGPVAVKSEDELPTLPPGFTWEKIPEGNPLRDRGDTHIPVAEGAVEYIRNQLNNPIKNKAVEAAEAKARAAERKLLEIQARERARESDEAKRLQDPVLRELYEDIKNKYGEEYADVYVKGIEAQRRQIEDQSVDEVRQKQQVMEVAHQFRNLADQHAVERYSEWARSGELRPRLEQAYRNYGAYIDAVEKMPDVGEFFQMFLDAQYARDPRVRQSMNQRETETRTKSAEEREAEKEAMKAEIRAELVKEAEERRQKRASNPLGNTGTGVPGARATRSEEAGVGGEGIKTPGQFRKASRERALGRLSGQ